MAPLSLVADDLGIYYDPSRESRLERLIAEATDLPASKIERANRVISRIRLSGLSKYNLNGEPLHDLPPGHKILVPGQVEDDASVLLGCSETRTNSDLLARTRGQNPKAVIIYKPTPGCGGRVAQGQG